VCGGAGGHGHGEAAEEVPAEPASEADPDVISEEEEEEEVSDDEA
jgi:hypothetical protein